MRRSSTADKNAPGLHPIEFSALWLMLGIGAFTLWARARHDWPFGPRRIEEAYVESPSVQGWMRDDRAFPGARRRRCIAR